MSLKKETPPQNSFCIVFLEIPSIFNPEIIYSEGPRGLTRHKHRLTLYPFHTSPYKPFPTSFCVEKVPSIYKRLHLSVIGVYVSQTESSFKRNEDSYKKKKKKEQGNDRERCIKGFIVGIFPVSLPRVSGRSRRPVLSSSSVSSLFVVLFVLSLSFLFVVVRRLVV